MESIRTFIAVELPEEARRQLQETQIQLQKQAGNSASKAVRWVATANIHLTLKFLGEVPAVKLQALAEALGVETAHHSGFDFSIEGSGAFPNLRRPRVIWAGVQAPDELRSLQQGIESATRKLGYPTEERPFSPHLTLGRVSPQAQPEDISQMVHALEDARVGMLATVKVDQIHLFRSDLRPSGPIYRVLQSFRLAERG